MGYGLIRKIPLELFPGNPVSQIYKAYRKGIFLRYLIDLGFKKEGIPILLFQKKKKRSLASVECRVQLEGTPAGKHAKINIRFERGHCFRVSFPDPVMGIDLFQKGLKLFHAGFTRIKMNPDGPAVSGKIGHFHQIYTLKPFQGLFRRRDSTCSVKSIDCKKNIRSRRSAPWKQEKAKKQENSHPPKGKRSQNKKQFFFPPPFFRTKIYYSPLFYPCREAKSESKRGLTQLWMPFILFAARKADPP